ncbi:SbcC/MukB-like Walker B domain-containing protein [Blautia sp.]
MKQAQSEFRELNKALKDITFNNERYEFIYMPSGHYRNYYDMIMDDFNVIQGESIFSGIFHETHKEVIDELFERLALNNESSSKTLAEFTDYRTYMDYDIKIIHSDGTFSYYSKVCEEKSGGETQTPFYVTVAASFVQLYTNNIGGEATGLVMFDEAFNNMDDERISGVLEFMNSLPLQLIIAAPPDKIQYIGPSMEETLLIMTDEKVDEIYRHLGRVPEKQMQQAQLAVLRELKTECSTPVARNFICWLMKRLEQGKTVKEYLNLDDTEGSRRLIRAIHKIETNQKEIYIREFSVQCFGDSKELEKKSGLIGKIFRRFSDDMEDMDNDVILAEYGIYRTPNYVYVKGSGRLRIGTPEAYDIDLRSLRQGIGLSGEDLDGLEWKVDVSVKRIITIENLTTFFRWEEPDSVLIYLGGYHNAVRRKFLQKLYQVFPEAEYFHFGDIDVGGFEIYEDLCRRTGIPFTTYKMGISELEQYEQYTRELTENDRKRMDSLLNNEAYENVWPILRYMKEHGKKLEQESIL